jgi:hypothetical protein
MIFVPSGRPLIDLLTRFDALRVSKHSHTFEERFESDASVHT